MEEDTGALINLTGNQIKEGWKWLYSEHGKTNLHAEVAKRSTAVDSRSRSQMLDSDEISTLVGVRGFESHPRHHTFFKIQVRCRVHFRRNVTVRGFNAGEKGK